MSELIYGRHAVLETLRSARRQIYRLWLEESAQAKGKGALKDIIALTKSTNVPARTIKGGLFDKLGRQHANPQGVALEVGDYPYVNLQDLFRWSGSSSSEQTALPPLILILDHIQDPQNMGTLFRTAETMAVQGVIIPERRAAGITAAVVSSSAGAVEHLRVARVTNLNRAIDELKERNYWIAGLDDAPDSVVPSARMLDGALAVVVGSEGEGISRLTREKCDYLVRLPMYGQIESLNAAVAGSIMLYLARQSHNHQS